MASTNKSIDDIITDVIEAEGGAKATNDPQDKGGRTQYGISEKSNPQAWADGKVTEKEAREIYLQKYVVYPGYHKIPPSHGKVQAQIIDFGVMSGPVIATQKLQEVIGAEVDGVFGPDTLKKLTESDPRTTNNQLVAKRAEMIARIVNKNPSQSKFVLGWIRRVIDFIW